MRYLKRILVGAAAFLVSVLLFHLIALSVMWRFPEIGVWLFPENYHELGWGGFFAINFPLWQSWIVGVFAFAITFAWMLRKSCTRL
ncbi:MAG: hypothetical protein DMG13_25415 [Acidobacteria bacterium]|nr:MAG: hypothetical protein DMG13_25415 [Acidobacteriota bacterium]